jgi:hypothetical protein
MDWLHRSTAMATNAFGARFAAMTAGHERKRRTGSVLTIQAVLPRAGNPCDPLLI